MSDEELGTCNHPWRKHANYHPKSEHCVIWTPRPSSDREESE